MKIIVLFLVSLGLLAGCSAPDPATAYERSLDRQMRKPSLYTYTLPPKAI